jgi:hypothetical protein
MKSQPTSSDASARLEMHTKMIFQRDVHGLRPRGESSNTIDLEDSLSDDISANTDGCDNGGYRYIMNYFPGLYYNITLITYRTTDRQCNSKRKGKPCDSEMVFAHSNAINRRKQ